MPRNIGKNIATFGIKYIDSVNITRDIMTAYDLSKVVNITRGHNDGV